MAEKIKDIDEELKEPLAIEIIQERKKIIQRLLGACIIFICTLLLWHFGSTFPPQLQSQEETGFSLKEEVIQWQEPAPIEVLIDESPLVAASDEVVSIQADDVEIENIVSLDENTETIFEPNIRIEKVDEKKTAPQKSEQASSKVTPKNTTFQMGSFKNKKNAEIFAKELQRLQWTVEIKEKESYFRVFVKNINSPQELKTIRAQVVDLLEVKETPAYAVQVGAFKQQARVKKIVEHLESNTFDVQVQPTIRNEVEISRIRVVGLHTEQLAESVRLKLIALGYVHATVINLK